MRRARLLELIDSLAPATRGGLSDVEAALFGPQAEFYNDSAYKRAACCSRRSGKTEGIAAWLFQGAELAPGELSVYVTINGRANARRIVGATFERLDRRHNLGLGRNGKVVQEVDGQLIVRHPNGHQIWLAGCKDKSEIDKFRGTFYQRAVIDEAQAFPDAVISELVKDAIEPALLDLKGQIALIGTPAPLPTGYFYEACEGENSSWSHYHWTVLDNPYIPHAAEWLENKRREERISEKDPTYIREWLGLWHRDEEALVYFYQATLNAWRGGPLPGGPYRYMLAVDLGDDDGTAFVLTANERGSPDVYVVRAWRRSGMNTAARAAMILKLQREFNISRTFIDTGGLGKAIWRDLVEIYGVPCEAAEKSEKRAAIENVRGALRAGTLKIVPSDCADLVGEMSVLPWNDKRNDHHEDFADDCCDALLYSYRAHYVTYRPQELLPEPGTREALNLQGVEDKRKLAEKLAKEQKRARKKANRQILQRIPGRRIRG